MRSLAASAAIMFALAGCARPTTTTATPTADPAQTGPSLTRTEWQLVELTVAGDTTAVPPDLDAVLRFDGEGGFSAQACNGMGGDVELTETHLIFDEEITMTEMGCPDLRGELDRVLASVAGEAVRWQIDVEQLRLSAPDGTTLTYRIRDSIYPHVAATEVLSGQRSGFQYRLAVEGSGQAIALVLDSREGPGRPWGRSGVAAPEPGDPALWSLVVAEIAGEALVGGFVPAETVRVTHQFEAGGHEVDLVLYSVDSSTWKVAAGFVCEHSPDSPIVGYDAAGRITDEWG